MTNIDAENFLGPVTELQTNGGTTLSAGMQIGRELLGEAPSETRQRRILFLTDMGEMNADHLGDMIKKHADEGVYVSIVAMGAEVASLGISSQILPVLFHDADRCR